MRFAIWLKTLYNTRIKQLIQVKTMLKVTIGTKVTGNWGAMFPTSEGEVIAIEYGDVTIQWIDDDNLDLEVVRAEKIHQPGWTSVNGSGIGIFIDDSFSDESYRDYQKLVAQHNPAQ